MSESPPETVPAPQRQASMNEDARVDDILERLLVLQTNANASVAVLSALASKPGNASASADPLYARGREVVAQRQNNFVSALGFFGGMWGHSVNHQLGLVCLEKAVDGGCAAALAVLCANDEDRRVRRSCFCVLRCVALADQTSFYADTMVAACKTLCARICELELVVSRDGYDYLEEYRQARDMGCPAATVFLGAELERNGDSAEALVCYETAAKGGYAAARYHLARCTRFGIGTPINRSLAFSVMERSSEQMFFWAMHDHAVMLMNTPTESHDSRRAKDEKAYVLLTKVEAGVSSACECKSAMNCRYLQFCSRPPNPHKQLALCYSTGRGVAQDTNKALFHAKLC